MKHKHKILKAFFTAPIIALPLVAASCNSKNNDSFPSSNVNSNSFYLNALEIALKTQYNEFKSKVTLIAEQYKYNNYSYDITSYITSAIANAKTMASKAKDKPANYNSSKFDQIRLRFAGSNISVVHSSSQSVNTYILHAYPNFVAATNPASKITMKTTLLLDEQSINFTYDFDVFTGFATYISGDGNGVVNDVKVIDNGNLIFAATDGGLVTYKWDGSGYETFVSKAGLNDARVLKLDVASNGKTVYVATSKGYAIGTSSDDEFYVFDSYTNIKNTFFNAQFIKVFNNGNNIIICDGGVAIGTKDGDRFDFAYPTIPTGAADIAYAGIVRANNTFYVGTVQGFFVGTPKMVDNKITYELTWQKVPNITSADYITDITSTSDSTTLFFSCNAEGIFKATLSNPTSSTYSYTPYDKGLNGLSQSAISMSADGNTLYAAGAGGFAVAFKSNDYKFTPYNSNTSGLGGGGCWELSISADNNTICTNSDAGMSVSRKYWYPQTKYNFELFAKNYFKNIIKLFY